MSRRITTDEVEKRFSRYERGSRAGQLNPRFEFQGPFKTGEKAKYTLDIYSLNRQNRARGPDDGYYFFWFLDTGQWHYFFINGKMNLYSSTADALEGKPVHLQTGNMTLRHVDFSLQTGANSIVFA